MALDQLLTPQPPAHLPTELPDARAQIVSDEYQALMASITPYTAFSGMLGRQQARRDLDWQKKGRKYDREGPGIVGAALDIPAATSTLASLTVQVYEDCEWQDSNDPLLKRILQLWAGKSCDQTELLRRLIRTLDGPGEGYQILHNDGQGDWWYQIAQTSNVTDGRNGQVEVRTRSTAQEGSRWHTIIDPQYVTHFHVADPEWEDEAWSPLRRGLPDLEQYRSACRTIGRNLDSQLAMNGIMWAEAVVGGSKWIQNYQSWAMRAINGDDGIEAVAPFPMSTVNEPKFIDVGRKDHSDQMAVADKNLISFARSMDTPTKMLVDGPGTANHWGDYIMNDYYADFTMSPRLRRAAGIVTAGHMRPWIKAIDAAASRYDPDKVRVWFEDSRIRTKTDNTDLICKAYEAGVANDSALAELAELRPDQIIQRPAEIDEYEAWLIRKTGNPSALAALAAEQGEVEGQQIRPGMRTNNPGEPTRPLEAGLEADYWDDLVPA